MGYVQGRERLRLCIDFVFEQGDATIQEVADALGLSYGAAQRALSRLADQGALVAHQLPGTRKLVYHRPLLRTPDSTDPLERAFAAPSAPEPTP